MSALSPPELAALRGAYGRFLEPGRVLLTGHSHQAWPDVVAAAPLECFEDAATFVDDKWGERVFPLVAQVGRGILERLGLDPADPIAFGSSTHELVFRLLGCLPPGARVVTTEGEFHSLDRQLRRLEEDGLRVHWVASEPRATLLERLREAVTPGTALLAVSAVFFEDAFVLPGLEELVLHAERQGALALIDAYHAFNVVPLPWGAAARHAFVTAGGYKYAAMGEGICFLRLPPAAERLRPPFTGWFADFGALEGPRRRGEPVGYAPGGARFAGATFDPTPFYRARAALGHFDRFGLSPARLREISLAQTAQILDALDRAGLGDLVRSPREPERRGGFVAVEVPGPPDRAAEVTRALRARRVFVDARGGRVRLGPAPYVSPKEIERGVSVLSEHLTR